MAKRKPARKPKPGMTRKRHRTLEEAQVAEYKRVKNEAARQSTIAADLMDDDRFPMFKDYLAKEALKVDRALTRVLNRGTKVIEKGEGKREEVVLSATGQLIEARVLGFKKGFLETFGERPQDAINFYQRLVEAEEEERAKLDEEEE